MSQDTSVFVQNPRQMISRKEANRLFLESFKEYELRKLLRILLSEFGDRIDIQSYTIFGALLAVPWSKLHFELLNNRTDRVCMFINLVTVGSCRHPSWHSKFDYEYMNALAGNTKKLLADRAADFFSVLYRHDVGLVNVTMHAWERFFERHMGLSPETAHAYWESEEMLCDMQNLFWNVRPAMLPKRQRHQHYHNGQPVHFLQGSEASVRFVVTVSLPKRLVTIEKEN